MKPEEVNHLCAQCENECKQSVTVSVVSCPMFTMKRADMENAPEVEE
jgi:hypothetical protein